MASNLVVKDSELTAYTRDLVAELEDLSEIADSYILCLQNVVRSAYVSIAMESAINARCGEIETAKAELEYSYEPLSKAVRSFVNEIASIDGFI